MSEDQTAFAAAYAEAERVRREAEIERARLLDAVAKEVWSAHVYDSFPYAGAEPDPRVYRGTGIGFLYGQPESERFARELGDWRVVPGSNRP